MSIHWQSTIVRYNTIEKAACTTLLQSSTTPLRGLWQFFVASVIVNYTKQFSNKAVYLASNLLKNYEYDSNHIVHLIKSPLCVFILDGKRGECATFYQRIQNCHDFEDNPQVIFELYDLATNEKVTDVQFSVHLLYKHR